MSDPMEDSDLSLGVRDGDGIEYPRPPACMYPQQATETDSLYPPKPRRSINFTVSLDCLPGRPIDVVYSEPTHGPNMPACAPTPMRLHLVPNKLPPGTGILTYPGHLGQIASVSGLHGSIIEDRSPLLAASFESSSSGRRLHLETLSSYTVMPFLRFIYTASYAASGDWEDVPTSVLLHCTMYWLGDLYDLPDLKSQAYVNVLRQFEFGCSSPMKPIDLCKAIDFAYKTLSGHETITDAIVQYCVTCCLSHKLHEDSDFRGLAYNVRAFHQDLTKACRNRGYEDESSAVIIQLPYKNFAPETYASRENPPIAGFHDIVHHFHSTDRFDDDTSPKKKQRIDLSERRASSPVAIPRVLGTSKQPATAATPTEETLASKKVELPIRQRGTEAQTPIYAPFNRNEPSKDNVAVPVRLRDDGLKKLSTAPPSLGIFDGGRFVANGSARNGRQFHRDGLIAEVQEAGSMWSYKGPKYGVSVPYVPPRMTSLPRESDNINDPPSEQMRKYGIPDYTARIAAICKKHEEETMASSEQESDKKADTPISGTFHQQQSHSETGANTTSSSAQSSMYFAKTEIAEPQELYQTVGGSGNRRHRYKRSPNALRPRAPRGVYASGQGPFFDGAPSNIAQTSAESTFEHAKEAKPDQPTVVPHKDFDPTNPWLRSTFTHLQPHRQSRVDSTPAYSSLGEKDKQAYWVRNSALQNAYMAETSRFTPSNVSPTLPPTVFGDLRPEHGDPMTRLGPDGTTLATRFLPTDRDLTSSSHMDYLQHVQTQSAQGLPLHPPVVSNQPEVSLPQLRSIPVPAQLNQQNLERKSELERIRELNILNGVGAAATSATAVRRAHDNTRNRALNDYGMQLQLLEQQNGYRLIRTGTEQDVINRAPGTTLPAAATPAPDLSGRHPLQGPQMYTMLLEQKAKKELLMARIAREDKILAKHRSDEPASATSTTAAEHGSEGPDSPDFDDFLGARAVPLSQLQQTEQPKVAVNEDCFSTTMTEREREQQGRIAAMYGVTTGSRRFQDLLDASASAQHRYNPMLHGFRNLYADKATSQISPVTAQEEPKAPTTTGRSPTDDFPNLNYPMHLITDDRPNSKLPVMDSITCGETTDRSPTDVHPNANFLVIDMLTSNKTPSESDVDMCETDSDSDMSWVDVPVVAAKPAEGTEQAVEQGSSPDSSSKPALTETRRSSTSSDSEWDLC
jgi:hypothetical protein